MAKTRINWYRDEDGNKVRVGSAEGQSRNAIPRKEQLPDELGPHGYTKTGKKRTEPISEEERNMYKGLGGREKTERMQKYVAVKMSGNSGSVKKLAKEYGINPSNFVRDLKKNRDKLDDYVLEQRARGLHVMGMGLQTMENYMLEKPLREGEEAEPVDIRTAAWIFHTIGKWVKELADLAPKQKTGVAQLVAMMAEEGISLEDLITMAKDGIIPENIDKNAYRKLLEAIGIEFDEKMFQAAQRGGGNLGDLDDSEVIDVQAEVDEFAKEKEKSQG